MSPEPGFLTTTQCCPFQRTGSQHQKLRACQIGPEKTMFMQDCLNIMLCICSSRCYKTCLQTANDQRESLQTFWSVPFVAYCIYSKDALVGVVN